MAASQTDYSELLEEISEAETKGLIEANTYTDNELFLINAIMEGSSYSVDKAVQIVLDDQLIFYKGVTEMSEVAYQYYKEQKKGVTADMNSFGLELIHNLERFVGWREWGLELQKEYKYIWSN